MEFVDRTLACSECGQPFMFTAGEQEFYDRKGFREPPRRCKPCREARKLRRTDKMTEGVVAPPVVDQDDDLGNRRAAPPVSVRGPREVRVMPASRAGREVFEAVCAQCGTQTQVPFRPVAGRPVYCKECYGRRSAAGGQP